MTDDPVYLDNAGLVLFSPFLPRFFRELGVLSDGPDGKPRINGTASASRAVHLLQYLADRRCDRPETALSLNKLLCGLAFALPIEPAIVPTLGDVELCDRLVQAVIANWTMIKDTSPAGLRETFIQREGRLDGREDSWNLRVQRKTVDVLVDRVPWSFAHIFHAWMPAPIHVTW